MAKRAAISIGIGGIGLGFGALYASHWREGPHVSRSGSSLKAFPLNAVGITAHYVASIPVPKPLRKGMYRLYCSATGCDASETEGQLETFSSLAQFFARGVPPELRPVDKSASLVVPCDGTVVAVGPVGPYGLIDVKGIKYHIRELTGAAEQEPLSETPVAVADREESGSRLWYTIVHLGPENIHRFASPASWSLQERRRIEGYLLWMNPAIEGLYTQNERVALLGTWKYGMFSMTAVGAAGRGSIWLEAESNAFRPRLKPMRDQISKHRYHPANVLHPGEGIGGFRLGSAIALVFEAPEKGFQFLVEAGDIVQMGQKLASVSRAAPSNLISPRGISERKNEHEAFDSRTTFRRAW